MSDYSRLPRRVDEALLCLLSRGAGSAVSAADRCCPLIIPPARRLSLSVNALVFCHHFLLVQVQTASWACTYSSSVCLISNSAGSTIATRCSGWRALSVGPLDSSPCSPQRWLATDTHTHIHTSLLLAGERVMFRYLISRPLFVGCNFVLKTVSINAGSSLGGFNTACDRYSL